MKCNKVKRLLNIYVDNELSHEMHAKVDGHIALCSNCNNALREEIHLKGIIAQSAPYPANPFLWTRVAEAIKEPLPIPIWITAPKILKVWASVAFILIILSGVALHKMPELETGTVESTPLESPALNIPATPENLEKITLNLLVYTNGKKLEVPYVKF